MQLTKPEEHRMAAENRVYRHSHRFDQIVRPREKEDRLSVSRIQIGFGTNKPVYH